MGEQLVKYYKFIGDQMGISGRMKLAQKTKIPVNQAALEPDSDELIDKFKTAIKEITGQSAPTL